MAAFKQSRSLVAGSRSQVSLCRGVCRPVVRPTTRQCGCRVHAAENEDAPSSSGQSDDLGFKAFVSEAEWRKIDQKVNKYPGQRTFTAIGTGGDDFKANMLAAVESVVGTVHQECVADRPSSGGKYLSVRIGPVWVQNADQVIQVFANMREDSRLKWYM